jgi:colicin import membrane protein
MMSIIQMKSIVITIILIAVQAGFTKAIAQNLAQNTVKNENVNTAKNTVLLASQEIANIKKEKSDIDANLKKQQAVCYKKFAVNNCLKDAKIEAQTALNAVKRREIAINDQQRNAKIESDQNKKEKAAENFFENRSGADKTSEVKDKTKTIKTTKPGKVIKTDAEILAEKNAADKSRADAAQKRLVELNQKQAAAQKKAKSRASKNSQSSANAVKFNQKLTQAEEHKQALEKANLNKNKTKAAPLPIPATTSP